jgi:hypothetical protein
MSQRMAPIPNNATDNRPSDGRPLGSMSLWYDYFGAIDDGAARGTPKGRAHDCGNRAVIRLGVCKFGHMGHNGPIVRLVRVS